MELGVHAIACGAQPARDVVADFLQHDVRRIGLTHDQWRAGPVDAALAAEVVVDLVAPNAFDLSDPTRWAGQADRMCAVLDDAAAAGIGLVYTTTGPARRLSWEDACSRFVEAVAPAASHAATVGVRLAIENTASVRADLGFVHRIADAVEVGRRAGVLVCADLFASGAERGLGRTLADGTDVVTHVQIADFVFGSLCSPDRAVPGDGDLAVLEALRALVASGYDGVLELELLGPRITAEGAVDANVRAVRALRTLLEQALGC